MARLRVFNATARTEIEMINKSESIEMEIFSGLESFIYKTDEDFAGSKIRGISLLLKRESGEA